MRFTKADARALLDALAEAEAEGPDGPRTLTAEEKARLDFEYGVLVEHSPHLRRMRKDAPPKPDDPQAALEEATKDVIERWYGTRPDTLSTPDEWENFELPNALADGDLSALFDNDGT